MGEEGIQLVIGRSEALVLFELLADFYNQSCLQVPGAAERLALVRLQGALERALVEPLMPEYNSLLDAARMRLASQYGSAQLSTE